MYKRDGKRNSRIGREPEGKSIPRFTKIPNRKSLGHDGIYGFWFKKFTSIHDELANEMNRCLKEAEIPE